MDLDLSDFDDEEFDGPILEDEVSDEPILDDPVFDDDTANEPVLDEPILDDEVSVEPVLDDPVLDDDVSDEPVLNEPILDEDEADDNPPAMDALVDEDLPTPTNAEAPTLAQEDMLDDGPGTDEPAPEADGLEVDAPAADTPEADTPEADTPEADTPAADTPEAAGLADIPKLNEEEEALFDISSIDDDLAKLELEMDAENDPPAADKPE